MISATGRMPVTAAPEAAPMIALSLIGVSSTRVGPNSLYRPPGQAEHAAHAARLARPALAAGDVLADDDHIGVAAHLATQRFIDRLSIGFS